MTWLLKDRKETMSTCFLMPNTPKLLLTELLTVDNLLPMVTCKVRKTCPVGRLFPSSVGVGT